MGIIKRRIAICLIFLMCINSFAAVVSDNDGSAFITKAEFDSLKNNFQSQIDNYNQSIDSKIDGAIASYLSGIRIETTQTLTNLYAQKGGSNLKWINLNELTTQTENENTLAGGIMLYGVGNSLYTGSSASGKAARIGYFGNVYWGSGADNSYPYWANKGGNWATARLMAHVNENWTGKWPAAFELNNSFKSGTTTNKLVRYYKYSKRIFMYGDTYWGNRLVSSKIDPTWSGPSADASGFLHLPYKNLADGEYYESAWFNWYKANGTTLETDLWPNYTVMNYEDIMSVDLSDAYNCAGLNVASWSNVRCSYEGDKFVWQKGSVAWITPTDNGSSFYNTTEQGSHYNWPTEFFTVAKASIPNYPERLTKLKAASEIYSNKENDAVPIYAGALVTSGCPKGTLEFDITFNKGTKDSAVSSTNIKYIGISFNSDKYTNTDSLTGNLKILSCTASGYSAVDKYSLNDLAKGTTYHFIIEIPSANTDLWMRIQGLNSSKNVYASFGPFVTANIGDITAKGDD